MFSLFNRLYSDMVTNIKNGVFFAKSVKMDINTSHNYYIECPKSLNQKNAVYANAVARLAGRN